jgi:hypothetical protein
MVPNNFALTITCRGDTDKVKRFTQALWSLLQHTDLHVYLGGPETGRALTLRHHDQDKLRFVCHSIQMLAEIAELQVGALPLVGAG